MQRFGILVGCLISAVGAWAGPAEDYAAGERAYNRGDVVGAIQDLRKAADAGHAKAQALLATILDQSEVDDEAVEYFRKSAAQGEPEGEYGLGYLYMVGEGVKKDLAEAHKWLSLAADKGHVPATQVLVAAYLKGDFSVSDANRAQVVQWMKVAADSNFYPAVEGLAKAYKEGAFGVTPDDKLAAEYQAKALKLKPPRPEKGKKSSSQTTQQAR